MEHVYRVEFLDPTKGDRAPERFTDLEKALDRAIILWGESKTAFVRLVLVNEHIGDSLLCYFRPLPSDLEIKKRLNDRYGKAAQPS